MAEHPANPPSRNHPLVPIGVLFATGIWLGDQIALPPGWLFASALAVGAASLLFQHRTFWLLGLAILLAGWTNLAHRTALLNPQDLRLVAGEAADQVVVHGRLLDSPSVAEMVYRDATNVSASVMLEARFIQFGRRPWQPAQGRLWVNSRGALPEDFQAGTLVAVRGVIQVPPGPAAPGLFNFREHLRHRGVYHQLRAGGVEDWTLLDDRPASTPWQKPLIAWARGCLSRGLPEEDQAVQLLWAMLLGWKTALTDEVAEPFMHSGTMHLFAISGLHVGLIAGILVALFRLFARSRILCGVVVVPLVWSYVAATGWQPSAIRAAIMASVIIAGVALERPSNLLNSLFAAGILILLWEPRQLFHASFQLSFFVVLAIALLMPLFDTLWKPALEPDPFLPDTLYPAWQKALLRQARRLANAAAVSAAAFLGSLPLIALYFNLVTPISLLANLAVVPLGGLAVMSGMGSLLTGAWFPAAGELFNHAGWFFMRCMMEISQRFASLPFSFQHVPSPGLPFFVVYYGVLLGVVSPYLLTARARLRLLALLLVSTAAWFAFQGFQRHVTLTVLPFQDGHAVLSQTRSPVPNLLIDCGRLEPAQQLVQPFLRARGLDRLSGLALTHGDLGQIGGAELIHTNFQPARIYCSPLAFQSQAYRRYLADFAQLPDQVQFLEAGASLGQWQVLHPAANDRFAAADDGALVLRGDFASARVLLLSDLGRAGQNRLMQRCSVADLRADILVTGRPTQSEPVAEAFLFAVRPKVLIVADAMYPATARASRAFQQRIAHYRLPVVYTRLSGAVTIRLTPGSWRIDTLDGRTIRSEGFDSRLRAPPTPDISEDDWYEMP